MFNTTFFEYLNETYRFAADYFLYSEQRYKASLMLAGGFLCIIGMVALITSFSWWWVIFWAALEAHNLAVLGSSLLLFAGLTIGYVVLKATFNYLTECIKLNWRQWLTQKTCKDYLENETNFLELSRFSEDLANPSQRIQEDINYFVELTIDLSNNLLKSTFMLAAFVTSLWILSGTLSLSLLGIHLFIPGYLVWIALFVAITATIIKQKLGASVQQLNDNDATNEALFRSELERIPQDAESISLERGQKYFKNALSHKYQDIYDNAYKKIQVKTKLRIFDTIFEQITEVIPYLAAAPLYFTNTIVLGQLMQIGYSFAEVNQSFSWFMDSYDELAWHQTNTKRLQELQKILKQENLCNAPKDIQRNMTPSTTAIMIENLSIVNPHNSTPIIQNLTITIEEKNHTFISGPSGMGKSTLFKAIAGTWKYGTGNINMPDESQICFLAQKATFPKSSLRQVLAYPKPLDSYTDEQFNDVLDKINLSDLKAKLDTTCEWGKILSGGQQQKIAFGRALLSKPKWLFLDESTAALDDASERNMYSLIQNELKDTTFVSIAHRQSVEKYHTQTLLFKATEEGRLSLSSSPSPAI